MTEFATMSVTFGHGAPGVVMLRKCEASCVELLETEGSELGFDIGVEG
jgi:hypothetical protein